MKGKKKLIGYIGKLGWENFKFERYAYGDETNVKELAELDIAKEDYEKDGNAIKVCITIEKK